MMADNQGTSVIEDRIGANTPKGEPNVHLTFKILAREKAWNEAFQVEILLLFISERQKHESFATWLNKIAETL